MAFKSTSTYFLAFARQTQTLAVHRNHTQWTWNPITSQNLRQISRVCGCQHHLPLLLKLATPWITTKLISKKSSHQNLGTHSNWCVIWKERTCNNWCGCLCVCARASSCNFIGIYNNHNPSLGVFQHGCKMLRQKIHMELPFNIANCLHIKTDNVNWTNAYMRVLCLTVFQWFFSEKSHHVGLNFAPRLKATNQLKDWLHSFARPCMTR